MRTERTELLVLLDLLAEELVQLAGENEAKADEAYIRSTSAKRADVETRVADAAHYGLCSGRSELARSVAARLYGIAGHYRRPDAPDGRVGRYSL